MEQRADGTRGMQTHLGRDAGSRTRQLGRMRNGRRRGGNWEPARLARCCSAALRLQSLQTPSALVSVHELPDMQASHARGWRSMLQCS